MASFELPDRSSQLLKSTNRPSSERELLVDVCTFEELSDELRQRAVEWLRQRYDRDGEDGCPASIPLRRTIIPDVEVSGIEFFRFNEPLPLRNREPGLFLQDCKLSLKFYCPVDKDPRPICEFTDIENVLEQAPESKVTELPHRQLLQTWDKLVFDPPIHEKMLLAITRLVSKSSQASKNRKQRIDYQPPWNGLILLWGPAGSGKTTLCRALAQRLSIVLNNHFKRSLLFELDAHSLYSKYFGESAKVVSTTFGSLSKMLEAEKDTMVFVLIDEIESLGNAREQSMSKDEPSDAMRAVNALLTAIDRLRFHPNFVVFCTSNLVQLMDPAFLDRIDFKWHIPRPCAQARYEILRQRFLDLWSDGWILQPPSQMGIELGSTDQILLPNVTCMPDCIADSIPSTPVGLTNKTSHAIISEPLFDEKDEIEDSLPNCEKMKAWYSHDRKHPASKLWEAAKKCEDLSGRTLHRLPAISLSMHSTNDPCSLDEAIDCLSKTVQDELHTMETLKT